ncbi:MAG: nuclear transport factor 2 family protein [Solirubrobacterales bacterium]
MATDSIHLDRSRQLYLAFAAGDREAVEALLAPEFSFHSPPDPELDRDGYFERCWPHAGNGTEFEFVRLVEAGEEVVVTYVGTRRDGSRFRNTEVLRFAGEQIAEAEVYFGWDLPRR